MFHSDELLLNTVRKKCKGLMLKYFYRKHLSLKSKNLHLLSFLGEQF